ncbi:hypothetical protein [Kitasatospora sp. NPDC088346]
MDEHLPVHPPQIKQIRAADLPDALLDALDDPPQTAVVIVVGVGALLH